MPIYQYRCQDCGHELEVKQSFSDDPLTSCPSCEGSLRKVFSAAGVVFKGSGFYRNDARPSGSSETATSAATTSSSSTSSSSSSSDS